MTRRALIAAVIVLAVVAGAGGVLYAFGTPQAPPQAAAPAAAPATAASPEGIAPQEAEAPAPEGGLAAEGGPAAAGGKVPAPDPSTPLAIEIPGCRCHSDDPKLVAEHAEYRMNQCAGCHAGQVPTGQ